MRLARGFGWLAVVSMCAAACLAADLKAGIRPDLNGGLKTRVRPSLAVVRQRAEQRGYRLRAVQWDAVLGQSWAVLEDAQHPERPWVAELTQPAGDHSAPSDVVPKAADVVAKTVRPAEPVVRFGDKVILWRSDANVRVQLSATAESYGAVGEEVTLRITGTGGTGDTGWKATGIVRGPGDVEMEP